MRIRQVGVMVGAAVLFAAIGGGSVQAGIGPPSQAGASARKASSWSAAQVSAAAFHTCAVTTGGAAKCWGNNSIGQLGDGSEDSSFIPVDVTGLTSGVASISTNGFFSCALTTEGGVKCWGSGGLGQLGNGSQDSSPVPVDVTGLTSGVTSISTGYYHACAVTSAGGAKCWGSNNFGRLGNGSTTLSSVPVDVTGLTSGVAAIEAGGDMTCALTTGGGVKCWGWNGFGQLGNTEDAHSTTPVDVPGVTSGVVAISAGAGEHICALTTVGGLKCWGWGVQGQLGNGTANSINATPTDVTGLTSGVSAIEAGGSHTCAMTTSGGAKCWGSNLHGQLGNGSGSLSTAPVDVTGLTSGVIAISTGDSHSCAVVEEDDGILCWGDNGSMQLGDGTGDDRATPVQVIGFGGHLPQGIEFPPLPAQVTYGASSMALEATASSGLDVTFSAEGACEMASEDAVAFTGTGLCTVTANQEGNEIHDADQVVRTTTVAPAATTTVLKAKPKKVKAGKKVTVTATVKKDAGAAGPITGKVRFLVNGKQVKAAKVQGNKVVAKLKLTGPVGKKMKIKALYVGAGNFAASGSKIVKVTLT